ncbi:MAG TPA: FAD-dependent monooxygenase [Polyangiales bacterium]|nr:FAD-dependent monooxygenase [Polyangiales bacterium]
MTVRAIVVGGGIGGLTAAIALRRAGVDVSIYERAQELKERGAALGVTSNAVAALRALGIHGALEAQGAVVEVFRIHDARGRQIADIPMKELQQELGVPSVCLQRSALQRVLLDAAQGCEIQLGAKCEGFEANGRGVRVRFADGRSAEADILIGADGLYSAVRQKLLGPEAPRYGGYVCWLATIPYQHPRLTNGYVGFYWGRGTRFGLIDIGNGEAYWWGTENRRQRADPNESAASIKQNVLRCFEGYADEVRSAVAATPADAVLQLDALDRPFSKQWGNGPVTLLGDAAHPMLTSLAQGACMAMEDAVVLGRCLATTRDAVQALRRYELLRRKRTQQMVRMSRILAKIEQFEHPAAVALRNACFRLQRPSMHREQSRPILTFVDPVAG